jgi:hypothetical protein
VEGSVVTLLQILAAFSEGAEESHSNTQDSRCTSRDSNQVPERLEVISTGVCQLARFIYMDCAVSRI